MQNRVQKHKGQTKRRGVGAYHLFIFYMVEIFNIIILKFKSQSVSVDNHEFENLCR